MAWSGTAGASGWYVNTIMNMFSGTVQTGTPTQLGLVGATDDPYMYCSLLSGATVNYTSPVAYGSSSPAWANTDEITGTGWLTGGVLLSTAYSGADVAGALSISGTSPYYLQYTWAHPLTVPNTTLTGIYGCILYFSAITAPVAKPCLLALSFGTTGYNTVAGTFGITPSGSGLSQITLTQ